MNPNPLQNLRDIHLPAPISFWPLAPGWYFLLAGILIILLISGFFAYKYWKKYAYRKTVLNKLQQLYTNYHQRPSETMMEISKLLRRSSLATASRNEVAGLYGIDWLHYLDRTAQTDQFTQGAGKILIELPYCGSINKQIDIEALYHLIKQWIKKNV